MNSPGCTARAATEPPPWRSALRAHDLALVIRDRKAQAQTAATAAQAHLTLDDAPAAIEWSESCLTIARGAYPYFRAQALLTLATAQRSTGETRSAIDAADQAASVATTCGFDRLKTEATAKLQEYR